MYGDASHHGVNWTNKTVWMKWNGIRTHALAHVLSMSNLYCIYGYGYMGKHHIERALYVRTYNFTKHLMIYWPLLLLSLVNHIELWFSTENTYVCVHQWITNGRLLVLRKINYSHSLTGPKFQIKIYAHAHAHASIQSKTRTNNVQELTADHTVHCLKRANERAHKYDIMCVRVFLLLLKY